MWLDIWDDPSKAFGNPLTLDCETTIRNKDIGKMQSSSFFPDNHMVCLGLKELDEEPDVFTPVMFSFTDFLEGHKTILLVGQNIKYDLLWLMRTYPSLHDQLHNLCIWDTQLAEYLLTGQDHKMASLDELAVQYGGTLKDDRIKEFWKAGVDTSDIPWSMLEEYQKYDVINTEIVFLEQLDQMLANPPLMRLYMTQCDAVMATTEMEYNGMKFDKELAVKLSEPLAKEAEQCRDAVADVMKVMGFPEASINVGSNQQISTLLFGGNVKYKEKDFILDEAGNKTYYKGGIRKGEAKMKFFEKEKHISGLVAPIFTKGKNGFYPVGDDQLSKVKKRFGDDDTVTQLVDCILKFRKLEKDVGTYYVGYAKQVMPDGMIHGNYNHTKTGTGRLSSSNPNLQNLSN